MIRFFKRNPHLLLVITLLSASCVPIEKTSFLGGKTDEKALYKNPLEERVIKVYDKLYVQILSIDEQTSRIFEGSNRSNLSQENAINLNSYQIDSDGNILMPFIGKVGVEGLTLAKARLKIMEELNQYVSKTEVILKFVNNKVTFLGEVNSPGIVYYYDNRITIFEAISSARGITSYARIDNITRVRNYKDSVEYKTIDLTQKDILGENDYIVQPGDIYIVHPLKNKYRRQRDYTFITTVLSSITTAIAVISLL